MSFFFNDTATTEIYTLSLHDALPIFLAERSLSRDRSRGTHGNPKGSLPMSLFRNAIHRLRRLFGRLPAPSRKGDRKSTRLNSSHANISYAVFCLKKKKQ